MLGKSVDKSDLRSALFTGSGLSFAVMTIFKNVMKVKMAEGNLTRQQLSEFIGQSVNASGHHSASTRFNGANRY